MTNSIDGFKNVHATGDNQANNATMTPRATAATANATATAANNLGNTTAAPDAASSASQKTTVMIEETKAKAADERAKTHEKTASGWNNGAAAAGAAGTAVASVTTICAVATGVGVATAPYGLIIAVAALATAAIVTTCTIAANSENNKAKEARGQQADHNANIQTISSGVKQSSEGVETLVQNSKASQQTPAPASPPGTTPTVTTAPPTTPPAN